VLLPPAAAMAVMRICDDRAHGAAQLAGWALDALNMWAAAPWGAATDASRSPRASPESGPHWARERCPASRLRDVAFALATCRPAMATLRNATAHVVLDATQATAQGAPLGAALQAAVRAEHERRALAAAAAEEHARALLRDGTAVMTLSLSSSVLRALCGTGTSADGAPARPRLRVTVCESRPLREGATTAARCAEAGHETQLITDAAAAVHLDSLRGDPGALVLVGADALTPCGGFVNKVGTRQLALAAADAGVPLYVIATADKMAAAEDATETEEMDASEIDSAPPPGVRCRNVYFEETPARLVTGGIITEHGAWLLPCRNRCVALTHAVPPPQAWRLQPRSRRASPQPCRASLRAHSSRRSDAEAPAGAAAVTHRIEH
jgi:translation initiation factor 2B subunit (eIF-2B alpha/beta/delta family)